MPLLIVAHQLDLGLGGIWGGIAAFIAVRMLFGALRWRSRRWLVAGTLMIDELRKAPESPRPRGLREHRGIFWHSLPASASSNLRECRTVPIVPRLALST